MLLFVAQDIQDIIPEDAKIGRLPDSIYTLNAFAFQGIDRPS
jgi:hypothetical protein